MWHSIGLWFSDHEWLAIWLEGVALVAIFIWDRIDAEGEHDERMAQIQIAKDQATATRLMVEAMEREERDRTRIRLFARVWMEGGRPLSLNISNLSEFDLWVDKVEVVATEIQGTQPGKHVLSRGIRLSQGHTESGFQLQGALITLNGNREQSIDVKFYVSVTASDLDDKSVTINSPEYQLVWGPAQRPYLLLLS